MQCAQCRKVLGGFHPDVIEHVADGGEESFKVDIVRQVINEAYMRPNEADYKVFLLGNAQKMNVSAQNALLKILEEPPANVVFILTVTSKSRMLETVLSRSVVFSLESVDAREGAAYLVEKHPALDYERAVTALQLCGGNLGKAFDILSQGRQGELTQLCAELCDGLLAAEEYTLLTALAGLQNDRQGTELVLELLKGVFRDALVDTNGGNAVSGMPEQAQRLRKSITRKKLLDLISLCDTLKEMVLSNGNSTLLITKICYSLRETIGR